MKETSHLTHIPKIPFVEIVWWSKIPCMDHEIQRQILWYCNLYFCTTLAWTPRSIPIIWSYLVDMMKIPFLRSVWWWNIGVGKFLKEWSLSFLTHNISKSNMVVVIVVNTQHTFFLIPMDKRKQKISITNIYHMMRKG